MHFKRSDISFSAGVRVCVFVFASGICLCILRIYLALRFIHYYGLAKFRDSD